MILGTLAHNEYVILAANTQISDIPKDSTKQPVANKDHSKGNLVLWQAPHQVAHPLPTLRYAFSFPCTSQNPSKNLPRPSLLSHSAYNRNYHGNQLTHAFTSGRRSLHIQKHTCSSCGYPAAKIRQCTHNLLPQPFTLFPFFPFHHLPKALIQCH